jgi:small subunit ribosomal protein S8
MDTVANMITNIRNAQAVAKPEVTVPYTRMAFDVAKILERKGFVAGVEKKSRKLLKSAKAYPCLEITLKYTEKIPAVSGFKKVSKSGQRIYVSSGDIKRVKQGHGIGIISTSKGIMTEYEAKRQNIGGEMLCEVW